LLDKPQVLAITKADVIDEEFQELLSPEIPDHIPHVFISAVTGKGIVQLKDLLWDALNADPIGAHKNHP